MATESFTAFHGHRQICTGDVQDVASAAFDIQQTAQQPVLIFDDLTGRTIELDLRHGAPAAVADYRVRHPVHDPATARQGRGRPRLGVVAREVTLLPRHWEWLADQPGGASAALRRLVDDARRAAAVPDRRREGQQTLYSAMFVLAGDLAGFEEAARALFANDAEGLESILATWPDDIAGYLDRLAKPYRD